MDFGGAKCLLGVHTCEEKELESELARGRSQTAMQMGQSFGQHGGSSGAGVAISAVLHWVQMDTVSPRRRKDDSRKGVTSSEVGLGRQTQLTVGGWATSLSLKGV